MKVFVALLVCFVAYTSAATIQTADETVQTACDSAHVGNKYAVPLVRSKYLECKKSMFFFHHLSLESCAKGSYFKQSCQECLKDNTSECSAQPEPEPEPVESSEESAEEPAPEPEEPVEESAEEPAPEPEEPSEESAETAAPEESAEAPAPEPEESAEESAETAAPEPEESAEESAETAAPEPEESAEESAETAAPEPVESGEESAETAAPEPVESGEGSAEPEEPVESGESSGESSCEVDCSGDAHYLVDPESCNHFIQCSNGTPYKMPCPAGLVFNPNVRPGPVCDYPTNYPCEGKPTCGTKPEEPKNGCESVKCNLEDLEDQYRPHPTSCEAFCQCSNGTPYEMPCPKGLEFNPELNVCDYPAVAGCKSEGK